MQLEGHVLYYSKVDSTKRKNTYTKQQRVSNKLSNNCTIETRSKNVDNWVSLCCTCHHVGAIARQESTQPHAFSTHTQKNEGTPHSLSGRRVKERAYR